MTHPVYRKRIIQNIKTAMSRFEEASDINHPGLIGRFREIAVEHLFRPLLPPNIEIGTGKIVDTQGNTSMETDIIIYAPNILPPIMHSERDGVFPIEACLYAIEVKSILNATAIKDTINKFKSIQSLRYTQAERRLNQIVYHNPLIVPAIFAFSSDLTLGGKTELQRFREYDSNFTYLRALCIAQRGYWYSRQQSPDLAVWQKCVASESHDEIIGFLCGVINTIPKALNRVRATVGDYLMSVDNSMYETENIKLD